MADKQILVIHHDYMTTRTIQSKLKSIGYSIPNIVLDPEDAISKIKEITPDVVLLDIDLKVPMDSLDLAFKIQKDYLIPIIFLSSKPQRSSLHQWGFFSCSIHPYDEKELSLMIDLVLCKSCLRRKIERQRIMLKELADNNQDGIIQIDYTCRVSEMNKVSETLTGWDLQDAITKNFLKIINIYKDDDLENPIDLTVLIENHERISFDKCSILSKDGNKTSISFVGIPIIDNSEIKSLLAILLIIKKL